jgi:hypothetical protein
MAEYTLADLDKVDDDIQDSSEPTEEQKQEAERKAAEEAKQAEAGNPGATNDVDDQDDNDDKEEDPKEDKKVDEPEEDADFYQEVDKRHGFELKVEFPEDVDPLSPEGAYLREKALITQTQQNFEDWIRESDPRAYSYMLHRRAGGTDEDFMKTPSLSLPEFETFKNSVDLQKSLYVKSLQNKGLEQYQIDMILEKDIKDGKLFDKAEAAYKAQEQADRQAVETAEKAARAREEAETKAITEMATTIEDLVNNNKLSTIAIPDAKKAEFIQHLKERLYFDGEKFFLFNMLTKDDAANLVQGEFFNFVKGDFGSLVKRAAKTEKAKELRRRIKRDQQTGKTGSQAETSTPGFTPLSDIF